VPSQQLPLQRGNRRLDLLDLTRQHLQHLPRQSGHARIGLIANNGDQFAHIAQALRRHEPELRQMRPQRVH
jgi:hypothetical protein